MTITAWTKPSPTYVAPHGHVQRAPVSDAGLAPHDSSDRMQPRDEPLMSARGERRLAPTVPAPEAWNGASWRQRTHDEVRSYLCQLSARRWSPTSEGSITDESRAAARRVADDIAQALRHYCQRTEDASVLQQGLWQLRGLMALSFEDPDWQPPA